MERERGASRPPVTNLSRFAVVQELPAALLTRAPDRSVEMPAASVSPTFVASRCGLGICAATPCPETEGCGPPPLHAHRPHYRPVFSWLVVLRHPTRYSSRRFAGYLRGAFEPMDARMLPRRSSPLDALMLPRWRRGAFQNWEALGEFHRRYGPSAAGCCQGEARRPVALGAPPAAPAPPTRATPYDQAAGTGPTCSGTCSGRGFALMYLTEPPCPNLIKPLSWLN